MDDVLLDRSKQVRVGSILNNAFSEHEFSPINDEVFSDKYDCHYPTSYPIEDVDPELSEGIIRRHNDRYESLRTADEEPGPLFGDTEDYVVRYIQNRCIATKLDNAALKQSVVTDDAGNAPPSPTHTPVDDCMYLVNALFDKFRMVLKLCPNKTPQVDVQVNCKMVMQAMKDVHEERAQAVEEVFPDVAITGLTAREQFFAEDPFAKILQFRLSATGKNAKFKPAVASGQCSSSHSAATAPPDNGQPGGSHSADARPPIPEDVPMTTSSNAAKRKRKQVRESIRDGPQETRQKKACRETMSRMISVAQHLEPIVTVRERLANDQKVRPTAIGQAMVPIPTTPDGLTDAEMQEAKEAPFKIRFTVNKGTP
jgi:hypothetical protein